MIKVILAEQIHLGEIKKLITKTNFKPYRYLLREVPDERLVDYLYNQILQTLTDKSSVTYIACVEDMVVGLATMKNLEWDTDIFGIKMANIAHLIADDSAITTEVIKGKLITAICQHCIKIGIKHLSCRVYTNDINSIHALEQKHFRLMDTILNHAFDFRKYPIKEFIPQYIIRPAQEGDDKEIAEVSRLAFSNYFSRFHIDNMLSRKAATNLYIRWAENVCHDYADTVFVAQSENRIVGFSAWKKAGMAEESIGIRVGTSSICAILPDQSGKGICKALTLEGMLWGKGKVDIIEGGTHINNSPVQRVLTELSWQVLDSWHTFRIWFPK